MTKNTTPRARKTATRAAAPAAARYTATPTAEIVSTGLSARTALIGVPAVRQPTQAQRRQARALTLAAAHRLAAEIVLLLADSDCRACDPEVSSGSDWSSTVTVEGADGAEGAIEALIVEACCRVGIDPK